MTAEILIFTNGQESTWPAIETGVWLAASMRRSVRLVGLDEDPSPAQIDEGVHPLEKIFTEAIEAFINAGVEYHLEVEVGHAEEVIPRRAKGTESLVVLGPLGRPPLTRLLSGRSFRHLLEQVSAPMLYVPQSRLPIKKVLVCLGGLGYEVTAENVAVQIAASAQAELTLFTVVPPIDLDYPSAREIQENWHRLAETDTPAGRSLRRGVEIASAMGLQAVVKVRNGKVLEEITSEIHERGYDLICMGSPLSGSSLRQLYTPNITAEIAEADHVPVLTARFVRAES